MLSMSSTTMDMCTVWMENLGESQATSDEWTENRQTDAFAAVPDVTASQQWQQQLLRHRWLTHSSRLSRPDSTQVSVYQQLTVPTVTTRSHTHRITRESSSQLDNKSKACAVKWRHLATSTRVEWNVHTRRRRSTCDDNEDTTCCWAVPLLYTDTHTHTHTHTQHCTYHRGKNKYKNT